MCRTSGTRATRRARRRLWRSGWRSSALPESLANAIPLSFRAGSSSASASRAPWRRRQLQDEIRAIHARGGLTIVFVTHDVEEALRLGTRVLILKDGCIEQFAAPEEIEESPATDFVRQLVEKV